MNNLLYFISGPTSVGKSSLALRLAKKINGIIINADSMQVYSNLKVLSARPSKKDHQIVDHKMYGYVDGSVRYNVAIWCNDITKIINQNLKNRIPSIIVGGTGMYIHSLLNGIVDMPFIDEKYKKKSKNILLEIGIKNFIKKLKEIDSDSLNNISLNDENRLRRIWEVFDSTGLTLSDLRKKKNKKFINNISYEIYLLLPSRDKIYLEVNKRFLLMMKGGAIEEVKKIINLNLDNSLPIMKAHGVPEISNYLMNLINLDDCIVKGQQVTRNYVKRQFTWWRSSTLPIKEVFDQFGNELDENLIKIS